MKPIWPKDYMKALTSLTRPTEAHQKRGSLKSKKKALRIA